MKAVQLEEIGKLKLVDKEKPRPAEGEVLIRIKACGICGSDIPRAYVNGSYHFPTVLGHELSGRVVDAGNDVSSDLIGKKVAIFPLVPCNECIYCKTANYVQCVNYNYFGSRTDGGFEEYLAVPIWNLVFIDESVSYQEAAMMEPATVAQHVINEADLKIGDNIVIYGAGTIGLIVAQWAKISGANKIILFDVDEEKVKFAKKLGYENAYNNRDVNVIETLIEVLNNKLPEKVIEATGNTHAFDQCVESVGTFGTIVLLGNPHSDMTVSRMNYDKFMRKEATIKGIYNSIYKNFPTDEWVNTADALKNKHLNLLPLITHECDIENLIPAFEMMRDNSEFHCKVMMVDNEQE